MLNFPDSPTNGQSFTGPNGVVWTWDGTKWVAVGGGASGGSGGATITVSDSPPASPMPGQLWFDSAGAQMYLREDDGTSIQWIPVVNQAGALTLAAATNVGRNLLHNPLFNIAQRGAGPFTTNAAYTLDRWRMDLSLDTLNVNPVDISAVTAFGDEAAIQGMQIGCVGNAGAGAFSAISQMVEGVRRLGGKTVTLSFWVYATAGTPKLGIGMRQHFGTGGSPAALVDLPGQSITANTTPTRYSVTFALPTTVGKALGTNGDNYTRVSFWPSCGTTNATTAGSPGVQTATFVLWGVQLEVGSQATPLEKPDPQQDLAKCQRFYESGVFEIAGSASNAAALGYMQPFNVMKRAVPTMGYSGGGSANVNAQTLVPNLQGFAVHCSSIGAGGYSFSGNFTASADL